jgi:hypothetical protein
MTENRPFLLRTAPTFDGRNKYERSSHLKTPNVPRVSDLAQCIYTEALSMRVCVVHRDLHHTATLPTAKLGSGTVVVRALCYKPGGRGFETRRSELIFSIYLIIPVALGPGVHSDSNRKEYEKQKKKCFWRVERG